MNLGGKQRVLTSRARSRKWVATGLGLLLAASVITPSAQPAAAVDDCTLGNTATSLADARAKLVAYESSPPVGGEAIICFEGALNYEASNNTTLPFAAPWPNARLRLIGTGAGATFTLNNGINAGFVQVTNSAVNVTVVFENLTLDGNSYSGSIVSATRLAGLNVEVRNSVVKNYRGLSTGSGAIPGNTVTISDSTIRNNQAPADGGGVYAVGDVFIEDSTFINNAAAGSGGAILSVGETNVTDSTFTGNFSTGAGDGGAIWSAGDILVYRSTFTANNTPQDPNPNPVPVPGDGGAIWGGSITDIYDSTFSGNTAVNGGAVYSSELNVADSTFANNQATAEGGAGYMTSGQILFSTFYENLAAPFTNPNNDVPGDAIYKEGGGFVSLGASILTSTSPYPQVGVGSVTPTPVTDTGGNVFSSSATQEIDLAPAQTLDYPSSLFGRSVPAVFGGNGLAENGGPTQTIMLASNSPALCAAGTVTLNGFDLRAYDQRGVQRTNPFDSGAVDAPAPAGGCGQLAATGSSASMALATLAALMLTLGLVSSGLQNRRRENASPS